MEGIYFIGDVVKQRRVWRSIRTGFVLSSAHRRLVCAQLSTQHLETTTPAEQALEKLGALPTRHPRDILPNGETHFQA